MAQRLNLEIKKKEKTRKWATKIKKTYPQSLPGKMMLKDIVYCWYMKRILIVTLFLFLIWFLFWSQKHWSSHFFQLVSVFMFCTVDCKLSIQSSHELLDLSYLFSDYLSDFDKCYNDIKYIPCEETFYNNLANTFKHNLLYYEHIAMFLPGRGVRDDALLVFIALKICKWNNMKKTFLSKTFFS